MLSLINPFTLKAKLIAGLAILAVLATTHGIAYYKGYTNATTKAEVEGYKERIRFLKRSVEVAKEAQRRNEAQLVLDRSTILELERKREELLAKPPEKEIQIFTIPEIKIIEGKKVIVEKEVERKVTKDSDVVLGNRDTKQLREFFSITD